MDTILYIIAGPLFLISIAGYFFVRFRLRPGEDSDLDDYYYEFENQHPGRKTAVVTCKVHNQSGDLIATASSTLMFVPLHASK